MICLKCAKPSKLRCPTCLKQGLKDSHYCSQECFKSDWLVHKKVHVSKTVYNPWPNYAYTGSLRPVYPLSPKRKVLSTIQCPDYANHPSGYSASEMSLRGSTKIRVLTPDEIDKMRVVAKVFISNSDGPASHGSWQTCH
jgi:methionyl aminopeptidase